MSGKLLLDTNAVVALFAADTTIQRILSSATGIAVPVIVIGELLYGANKSSRRQENTNRVDRFAAANDILDVDISTARAYGLIRDQLRLKGRPLPENDIWIAAIAIQHGLILITRDAHFAHVPGLVRTSW